MIWYEDYDLKISFNVNLATSIHERKILPSMTDEEKEDIAKLPLISVRPIEAVITDLRSSELRQYQFTIPKDTKSDGASIPRIFWTILGITPTDPRVICGAFIHDYICLHHEVLGHDRYLATRVFEKMIDTGGVDDLRRFIMFHAVDNYQKFIKWD